MSGDVAMRTLGDNFPVPTFDDPAWVMPKPLSEAKVAIVTSAAIHTSGDERFTQGDTTFRWIPRASRDLILGHWSPNFDRSGFVLDHNVVFPIDRLEELAADGTIGSVADRHVAFAGNQPDDVATIIHDTGPAAAAQLAADGVDVVLLTPV